MSNAYEELYNKIKTLNKQWFYDKTEITSLINGKANVNHAHTDKEDAIELITGTTTNSGNVFGGTSTKLNSLQNGTKILYKTPAQSSTDINTAYLQLTLANGTTSRNYLCDATGGFLMTKEIPANTVLLLVYVTSFQSRWQIISRSNDATTNSSGLMSKTDKAKLDGLNNFSGSYNDLTDKPTIPTATSDLTNDGDGTGPFLTGHDLTNYLQKSDVKDNLTSTDTNKPLSAKQGKELKSLVDGKQDIIKSITVTDDGRLYLLTQVPKYITYSTTKSMLTYENDYADISIKVTDENQEIIEGAEVQFYIIFATGSSSPTRYLYTDNTGTCTTRVFSEELSTSNQINIKYGEYTSRYNIGRLPSIDDYDTPL